MPVTVITGASTGIGEALARELARRGHAVGLIARRGELLEALAQQIRGGGGRAAVAACDVTDRVGLAAAVARIESELGPTDLLVANAGSGQPTPGHRLDVDAVERIWKLNINGVLYAIDAVLPGMLARGRGHISAVSSVAGWRGLRGNGAYCASKAAVSTLLESFRSDLKPKGIAVTTIHPGFIQTPLTDKNQYYMPFLAPADAAARVFADGLLARQSEVNYPVRMRWLMGLGRVLPNWLWGLVMSRFRMG